MNELLNKYKEERGFQAAIIAEMALIELSKEEEAVFALEKAFETGNISVRSSSRKKGRTISKSTFTSRKPLKRNSEFRTNWNKS